MASMTVLVGDPPYGKERLYTTLRFVLAALTAGHIVNLFILEDAAFIAKKGQKPMELPGLLEHDVMPNCGELLKASISQGAQVKICGVCASERGLVQEELVDGANISTMHDLVDWVVNTDKTVFF
ncbi:DsrE/DsrF/TusD sulfur relay family protein [Chloroflexota bacterium]